MLGDTIKRLKENMAMSHISCLQCWHFDRSLKEIVNYEGVKVGIMRGCKNYADCHNGGRKSLWAQR